jgi:hypothetical protein
MTEQELGRAKVARNLENAIERLQEDLARIEIWASALGCFSQPIPDYKPGNDFMLPQAKPGDGAKPFESSQRVYR